MPFRTKCLRNLYNKIQLESTSPLKFCPFKHSRWRPLLKIEKKWFVAATWPWVVQHILGFFSKFILIRHIMKKHQNLLLRNLGWNELWLANFQYIYDACVHTNEGVGKRSRMMQAIVVKFHPLSVIIKNCNLLLWNHWANWNQTWYKCSLDGALKIGGFFSTGNK